MIIGDYIRKLLDERKRVVLPGFGNLQVKETTGKVYPSRSRMDPPGMFVRFDPSFSKDDGLLASAFCEGEELQLEEAGQRVLELIDAIKFALDKGDYYALPGTGTFSRDVDGKIHFLVDSDWVLEPDQYGLESIELLELEDEPIKEEKAPVLDVSVEKATVSEPRQPIARVTHQPSAHRPVEKRNRRAYRWRIIWIVAAALIVILVVLIIVPTDKIGNGNRIPGDRGKQPPREVLQQGEIQPEAQPEVVEQEAIEENQTETTPAVIEPEPAKEAHQYYIIAGSFKHLKYASDLHDKLKARGFQAEVLVTGNRMYRVSVASYATEQEAEQALIGIKTKTGLESSWLLNN